ncbi:hypothetical protein [Bradyrhizobium sp. USDA 3364]
MLVHSSLHGSRVREIAAWLGVQIFGSVASSRSQLDHRHAKSLPARLCCGDRSRHVLISQRKHLARGANLRSARAAPDRRAASTPDADGMSIEQALP